MVKKENYPTFEENLKQLEDIVEQLDMRKAHAIHAYLTSPARLAAKSTTSFTESWPARVILSGDLAE